MKNKLRIVLAQLNFLVGDIEGNTQKIIANAIKARDELKANVIVFPELTLTSYPPEDLLLRPDLYRRVNTALQILAREITGIDIIVGYPECHANQHFNAACLIRDGKIIGQYRKQHLPNYGVFDEKRYFTQGSTPCIVEIQNIRIAITICEDLWYPEPMAQAIAAKANLIISINASPFHKEKFLEREAIMTQRVKEGKIPLLYVNLVGGQDELVFDGGSFAIDSETKIAAHADFFVEQLLPIDIDINKNHSCALKHTPLPSKPITEKLVYDALVLGVRDYIEKNHFPSVVIGLSGGIDSALTLAIAVDAIGKERVEVILMPSRYTAEISVIDAKKQADIMGVKYSIISIEPIFQAFLASLADEFSSYSPDTTEENLQARCRGTLLMAISNKKGALVLSTGNKSETAVGYSTLYGDMAGGFCMLKDVLKTWVYRLAHYRNSLSATPIIPQRTIERAPSAELALNQKDEDSLPPYPILDEILQRYIVKDEDYTTIVAAGFEATTVEKVIKMVDRNEYKRRQAPPGVRISLRAFGRDRRYPITSGFGKKV